MAVQLNALSLVRRVRTQIWWDGEDIRRTRSQYLDFHVDGLPLERHAPVAGGLLTELNRAWLHAVDGSVDALIGRAPHDRLRGRVPLLVCPECGELGCGALAARIGVDLTTVRWSHWTWQDHLGEHDPGCRIPTFACDREAYERVMLDAAEQVRRLPPPEVERFGVRMISRQRRPAVPMPRG